MDSHAAGRQGGSGDTFDWSRIPAAFQYPLILAGGLNPRNVAQAVSEVRPYAVDVSSGVESSRGVKDATLIRQFCKEVYRVDCQH
jgi:phosphoribosylanthranilate isomerase